MFFNATPLVLLLQLLGGLPQGTPAVRVEGQLSGKPDDCSYMYGPVCLWRDSRDLMAYY